MDTEDDLINEEFFAQFKQSVQNSKETQECKHENMIPSEEGEVCMDCGEVKQILDDHSPEWRFYKENDSKQSSDPSRCFIRKYEEKSIYRDIEQYNIPKDVVDIANSNYALITEDSILRGNSRKGLIVACIFYGFEDLGQRKSQDEIKNLFGINKKILSNGMKMFNLKIKRSPLYTSPLDFIPKIMSKFSLSEKHSQFIIKLFSKICSKSAFINRSNPDSIAAGLSYFVLKHINYPVSLTEFSKRVGLSDITIHKISKKIKDIVEQTL